MASTVYTTPRARLSFAHLTKPKEQKNEDGTVTEKYRVDLVFDKSEFTNPQGMSAKSTSWQAIYAAAQALFNENFAKDGRQFMPNMFLKDNDVPNTKGSIPSLKYPNLKGTFTVSMTSQNMPECRDAAGRIVPPNEVARVFYAGCYVRAAMVIKEFKHAKGSGIARYFNGIQKMGDAEAWGASGSTEDAFDAVEDGSDNPANYPAPTNIAPMPPVAQAAPAVPAAPVVAPAAPPVPAVFPPAGWLAHPTAPGFFYQGQEVLSEADLRARTGALSAANFFPQ